MSNNYTKEEQAIIDMPPNEYMNKTQLEYFKGILLSMQKSILEKASATTSNLQREVLLVPDEFDRASIEEEHALELKARQRESNLLVKIDQSLKRIENEEYGYCEETGDEIGIQRLIARPTATLCLEEQERRERAEKMFG